MPVCHPASSYPFQNWKIIIFDKNELHVADAILRCIDEYLSRFGLFRETRSMRGTRWDLGSQQTRNKRLDATDRKRWPEAGQCRSVA